MPSLLFQVVIQFQNMTQFEILDGLHSKTRIEYIECKPTMYDKKAGFGCINDHTLDRHKRFIDDGLILQGSSFIENCKLAFIFEFPYRNIEKHFEKELDKSKGKRGRGNFGFKNWIDANPKLLFFNKELVEKNNHRISGGNYTNPKQPWLYHWLMDHNEIV